MSELEELRRRVNDTIVQTRCDRRTLATLLEFFRNKGIHVSSLSDLIRVTMEQMRHFATEFEGAKDILSTEDATYILKSLGRASLNPGGRNMFTHVQQMQKESIYLDGGDINYVNRRRIKGKLIEEKEMKELRTLAEEIAPGIVAQARLGGEKEKEVETTAEAIKRRELEDQDMKTEFSKPPANISKYEGGNAPMVDDSKPKV